MKTSKTKTEIVDFILTARRLSHVLLKNRTPSALIDPSYHKAVIIYSEMILDWVGVEYED